MKPNIKLRIVAVLLGTGIATWAQSLPVIDDFTTGTYQKSLETGSDFNTQAGNPLHMAGGARRTAFIVAGNQLHQTATMHFLNQGMLTVETGSRLFHRLEVAYGVDPYTGANKPLGLNLTPYDRFRVHFDTNDLGLNFNIVVFFDNGSRYVSLGYNVNPNPSGLAFDQDFKFADFSGVSGTDWAHVDYIVLVFQSASAVGGNDFAVKSLTVRNGI